MTHARAWRRSLIVVVALQACACALGLCREPLASRLDEGLQRALLGELMPDGPETMLTPLPTSPRGGVVLPTPSPAVSPSASPGIVTDLFGHLRMRVLDPNSTLGTDFVDDCFERIGQILVEDANALPPTVAPPLLEERLDAVHERWYLVTVEPGTYAEAEEVFRARGELYADVVYGSASLELFLVNPSTMRQFAQLFVGDLRRYVTHVFENFPMRPAVDSAIAAIGFPTEAFQGATGIGYSVAILDTGVASEHFPGQILDGACFSSQELVLVSGLRSSALCPKGEPVEDDWAFVYPEEGFGVTWHYDPVGVRGAAVGEACAWSNDCQHGTQVAYIAAGGNRPGSTQVGVAPGAQIIAIQVGSTMPGGYCFEANFDEDPCVVIFPLDVLRALRHLESLMPELEAGDAPLVAVNLSFQLGKLCGKPVDGEPCKVDADEARWSPASYKYPCKLNPLARYVRSLRASGAWTVIAAGNRDAGEMLGVVASPACIADALTVAGSTDGFELSDTSMLGSLVDFVAPGVGVTTPAHVASNTGTSFAAPQVTGLLTLLAERSEGCREGVGDGIDWLLGRRGPITIDDDFIPALGIGVDPNALALRVGSEESLPCSPR